ncbi:MAG: hypothetical protein JW811_01905 [Clostridiales bacterium]|nr:hypothetical protein [Clostridiales bacterium]
MRGMHAATKKIEAFLLALLLLVSGALPAAAGTADVSILMADIDWNGIGHTFCGFDSKQQLLDAVSGYAQAIAELTGRDRWTEFYGPGGVTVEIRFTERASHVEGAYQSYAAKIPRIYINRSMAEYGFWPMAHEITHLICPEYSSLSLREGLACYMQDEVAQIPAPFNYGLDAHACAYLYVAENDHEVLDLMGGAAVATGGKRAAFYLCSYSFSRYLIETYGLPAFMELYESGNIAKACRLVYGHDIDGLVEDWEQYLYEYPAKMTREELDQALADIMALHGVSTAP